MGMRVVKSFKNDVVLITLTLIGFLWWIVVIFFTLIVNFFFLEEYLWEEGKWVF